MATTTNYGWTTPDDTALVKDGASAIRTLGTSIDTTTKNLNPSTTLGDIEYRSSTANTNTRLGIGTTGQILTVAAGVPSWATPAVPSGTPTGTVIFYAANSAPTGFLKANGAAVSRTTYADLFTAIGTTFGAGDGSTTFLLPDLRGRFTRSWADNGSIDSGRAFGSTQSATSFLVNSNTNPVAGVKNSDGTDGTATSRTASGFQDVTSDYYTVRPTNIALLACIKF
jgi:microcystin-dependent protein